MVILNECDESFLPLAVQQHGEFLDIQMKMLFVYGTSNPSSHFQHRSSHFATTKQHFRDGL